MKFCLQAVSFQNFISVLINFRDGKINSHIYNIMIQTHWQFQEPFCESKGMASNIHISSIFITNTGGNQPFWGVPSGWVSVAKEDGIWCREWIRGSQRRTMRS